MSRKNTLRLSILLLLSIGISGCLKNSNQFQMQSAQDVEAIGKACEDIAKLQIETWSARDPEKLREVYTEDIIHFDSGLTLVGIDEVVDMAKGMLGGNKTWRMEAGETYISKEKCLGTWINWDIDGLSEANPGVEFDLLETEGDKISYWRLFYGENFNFLPIDYKFLTMFENAWSANDKNILVDIYTENATLKDTLFGISVEGLENIADYAQNFLELSQGASWTLIKAFTERVRVPIQFREEYPFPSSGGVFGVNTTKPNGTNCEIHVVVILMPDANGKIQTQETFYNADTLVECGWVK